MVNNMRKEKSILQSAGVGLEDIPVAINHDFPDDDIDNDGISTKLNTDCLLILGLKPEDLI